MTGLIINFTCNQSHTREGNTRREAEEDLCVFRDRSSVASKGLIMTSAEPASGKENNPAKSNTENEFLCLTWGGRGG